MDLAEEGEIMEDKRGEREGEKDETATFRGSAGKCQVKVVWMVLQIPLRWRGDVRAV